MFLRLLHTVLFFTLPVVVSALDLDLDSPGSSDHDLFFSDPGLLSDQSAAFLDQKVSPPFDLTELPSSSNFSPLDASSDIFLEGEGDIGNHDSNVLFPSGENGDDTSLLSLLSEPAHVNGEEEFYQDDANPGSLVATVDENTFSSSDNDDADGGGSGSGEIADLSDIDQQLLLNPLGGLSRDRGKINPFCALYTKNYNPVGVCAPNTAEDQIQVYQIMGSHSAWDGYKVWEVNHATYGKFDIFTLIEICLDYFFFLLHVILDQPISLSSSFLT